MEDKPSHLLEPVGALAARVLPAPLYRALTHVFAQGLQGCSLVGGTALAGYFAGHRRSDDLDLFVRDASSFKATTLAVASLAQLDAEIQVDQSTAQYYSVTGKLESHSFTVQVVLEPNLFRVGEFCVADDGVTVASITTLLKQKAATLVSRASEKDMVDLLWLLARFPDLKLDTLVALGREIDAGVSAENMLLVLAGSHWTEQACGFGLAADAAEIFEQITRFRDQLMLGLDRVAQRQPAPELAQLVRALK
jgi:hypothetical protein